MQSIKDVLTSLVDDGMVESEKIGTSVYFWSLPSKALKKKNEQVRLIEDELKAEREKNTRYTTSVERLRAEAESSASQDLEAKRDELENEIERMVVERKRLQRELDAHKENDPEAYAKMRDSTNIAKKAANRWIENVFLVKSWLKNKFRVEESIIEQQFGIPSDLDYFN